MNVKFCVKLNQKILPFLFALRVSDTEDSLMENSCNYLLSDDDVLDLTLKFIGHDVCLCYSVILVNNEEEIEKKAWEL